MIKGFGFGKLLKQLFIIGLISCFGLLASSFVNASDGFVRQIGVIGYSPYNSGINLAVLNKGSFLSQNFGVAKDLFFLDTDRYFAWLINPSLGVKGLYMHWKCGQGFATAYYNCDEVIDDGINILQPNPGNCHKVDITTGTVEVLAGFLSSVNSSDYVWFYGGGASYCGLYGGHSQGLCISSSQYHQSICFGGCTSSSAGGVCNFMQGTDYGWAVDGSLDLPGDFASINRYILMPSPAVLNQGESGNGTVGDNVNGNIQGFSTGGNITYECTNKKALEYYNSVGLSKNLCFGGLDNYNTGNITVPTPGTGKDILDIWAETALVNGETYGYEEWFSYYRNAYNNLNMVALSNPFTGKPDVLQSLFRMIDTYGASVSDRVIIEYCDLLLYKNLTGTYNGILGNEPCSVNGQNAINYYYNYGSGYTTIIGNNVFDGTGEVITDGSVFMEKFINKLKTQFVIDRSNVGLGVLPRYIISFMVFLVLFRFLSH